MPSGSSRSKTFRGLSFVECPESKFNCTAVVGSKQFHQNQWTRHSIMAEETAESAANAARQEPAQRFGKCRLCVSRFAQSRWIAAQTTSLRKSPARATMSPTGWAGGGTHACSHLDFDLGGWRGRGGCGLGIGGTQAQGGICRQKPQRHTSRCRARDRGRRVLFDGSGRGGVTAG